jgi:hypothetical protein
MELTPSAFSTRCSKCCQLSTQSQLQDSSYVGDHECCLVNLDSPKHSWHNTLSSRTHHKAHTNMCSGRRPACFEFRRVETCWHRRLVAWPLAWRRQRPATGLWALFFVVSTTADCSLFHQENVGGFDRFRSLLHRAPDRQRSLWLNSQVFTASLPGSSTSQLFSGVLVRTRPRPALTGREGNSSRSVTTVPSPQNRRGGIRHGVNALPILVTIGPGESERRAFLDLDGGASLQPGLAFAEPIQP